MKKQSESDSEYIERLQRSLNRIAQRELELCDQVDLLTTENKRLGRYFDAVEELMITDSKSAWDEYLEAKSDIAQVGQK